MFNTKALFKYMLEGLAVGIVAKMTLGDRITQEELLMLALTAAATFAILDTLAPMIGLGAKIGTGMAMGQQMLAEGYEDSSQYNIGCGGQDDIQENYRDLKEYEEVPVI